MLTKDYLLSIANKGPQSYANAIMEIWTEPSEVFDGRMMIGGVLRAINRFTTDMRFGGSFVEDVTDEECAKLGDLLDETLRRMASAETISNAEPLALQKIAPDMCVSKKRKRKYGFDQYKDKHFTIYVLAGGEASHPISTPVILDGKLYKSVYSFWLGRPVYLLDQPDGFQKSEGGTQE